MPPRILVADDHPLTAEGIRKFLVELPAEVEVAFAPEEVRRRLVAETFDLLVLDISFRGSDQTGFDLLRELTSSVPELPILMASMFDDIALQNVARREGARGFVSKMDIGPVLIEAARSVLNGGSCFHLGVGSPSRALTPRQLEISDQLGQGMHEREIAAKLGLSLRMVETHLHKAKTAVRARSLVHLLAIFVEKGYRLLPRSRKKDKISPEPKAPS